MNKSILWKLFTGTMILGLVLSACAGKAAAPVQKFTSASGFVCPEPFKRFDIGSDGNVLVCCGHWLPTSIGNFIKDPVDSVLNSEKAQQLRRSVTDGTYQYCNHLDCASMIHDRLLPHDNVADADIEHAIKFQDFRVKRVEQVLFALDQSCNLSCPSCRREQIMEKTSDVQEKAEAVEQKLVPMLPHVATLNLNSAGELFASKPSRRLLELIDDVKFPDLKLQIISNGTLFNEKEWNKFPGIHKKIQWVRISIDAARPRTFEKLRRLGIHAIFLDNIRFLKRLRQEGVIPQLIFSFTYQLDNFREMAEFVEFARDMLCDRIVFERLQNLGTFTHEEFLERAVHQIEHRLHREFLQVLNNPIFLSGDVWQDFDDMLVNSTVLEQATV